MSDTSAENLLRREPAGGAPPVDDGGPPGQVGFGQVYRWAVAAALGVLTVVLGAYSLYLVRSVLVLVIIALFIAVGLDPAVRWLVRRGPRRGVAVGIIFLTAIALLGGFLAAVIPPLLREGGELFSNLPGYVERLPEQSGFYRDLAERYNFTEKLSQ